MLRKHTRATRSSDEFDDIMTKIQAASKYEDEIVSLQTSLRTALDENREYEMSIEELTRRLAGAGCAAQ